MKKKLIAIATSAMMAVTMLPSLAFADDAPTGSTVALTSDLTIFEDDFGTDLDEFVNQNLAPVTVDKGTASFKTEKGKKLPYKTGFTKFNQSKPEEQTGNYIAYEIKFGKATTNATTVTLVGGESGKDKVVPQSSFDNSTADSNKDSLNVIQRITASDKDKTRTVEVDYDGDKTADETLTMDFSAVTCETADEYDAAVKLEQRKADAKTELSTYVRTETWNSDYDKEDLDAAREKGDKLIDAATTTDEVTAKLKEAKALVDAVPTKAEKAAALSEAKKTAKADLDEYFAKLKEADYTEANWTKIKEAKEAGDAAIDAAENAEAVTSALEGAKKAISLIPAKADADAVAEVTKKIDAIDSTEYATMTLDELEAAWTALQEIGDTFANLSPAAQAELAKAPAQRSAAAGSVLEKYQNAAKAYLAAYAELVGNDLNYTSGAVTNDVLNATEKVTGKAQFLQGLFKDDTDYKDALTQTIADSKIGDAVEAVGTYTDTLLQDQYNKTSKAFKALKDVTAVTADNVKAVENAMSLYNELSGMNADKAGEFKDRAEELTKLLAAYANAQSAAEAALKLNNATVTVAPQTYSGAAVMPAAKVVIGTTTVPASEYDVYFQNNVNIGTASAVVVAKNSSKYVGSKAATFSINAKTVASATVSGISNKTYTGKAITQSVKVVVDGRTLENNKDYTVSYASNKSVGKATVTITGKGNYTGSINKTFRITPAKAAISSLKAGKKKMTVKTKAQSGAKYQVAYKVSGAKKYKTVKTSSTKKVISKLKRGKRYAVKVRAYKSIDGKTYYGSYSKIKTVRVK